MRHQDFIVRARANTLCLATIRLGMQSQKCGMFRPGALLNRSRRALHPGPVPHRFAWAHVAGMEFAVAVLRIPAFPVGVSGAAPCGHLAGLARRGAGPGAAGRKGCVAPSPTPRGRAASPSSRGAVPDRCTGADVAHCKGPMTGGFGRVLGSKGLLLLVTLRAGRMSGAMNAVSDGSPPADAPHTERFVRLRHLLSRTRTPPAFCHPSLRRPRILYCDATAVGRRTGHCPRHGVRKSAR